MSRKARLSLQRWGNSLAVRIPAAVARAAHLGVGVPVELHLQDGGVLVRPIGPAQLTLEQKLAGFDPLRHGSEVMAVNPVGAEQL